MFSSAGYAGTQIMIGKIIDAMKAKNYQVPKWVLATYDNAEQSKDPTKLRISTSNSDDFKEALKKVTKGEAVTGEAQATKGN